MEKWIKILDFAFVKCTPILAMCPALIVSFFAYFTTGMDGSALELAYPMWYDKSQKNFFLSNWCFSNCFPFQRFPFETTTPIPYLFAMMVQYILVSNVMVTITCLALFGVGTCLMLFPLANDVKCSLRAIKHNAKLKRNRSKSVTQLSQFVEFHSKLIQLSKSLPIDDMTRFHLLFSSFSDWFTINRTFRSQFSWLHLHGVLLAFVLWCCCWKWNWLNILIPFLSIKYVKLHVDDIFFFAKGCK